jgi:hypothetical protein
VNADWGDERRENLRPQLPAAQQDKTAGRAEQPHRAVSAGRSEQESIYLRIEARCPAKWPTQQTNIHGRSAASISSLANGALGEQRELFQCLLNEVGWAGLKDGNRI